jgi:D-alanyl-D-alanine carboxypeptidase
LHQFVQSGRRIFGKRPFDGLALHKKTNMKNFLIAGSVFLGGFLTREQDISQPIKSCNQDIVFNKGYSKATTLDSIMTLYTTNGLPGVSVAIFTEKEGWWAGARGYANLEKKIPMDNCHLQYLQSVCKKGNRKDVA